MQAGAAIVSHFGRKWKRIKKTTSKSLRDLSKSIWKADEKKQESRPQGEFLLALFILNGVEVNLTWAVFLV